jgi:hypothetical protein
MKTEEYVQISEPMVVVETEQDDETRNKKEEGRRRILGHLDVEDKDNLEVVEI